MFGYTEKGIKFNIAVFTNNILGMPTHGKVKKKVIGVHRECLVTLKKH